jgi:hypothetical protein
MSSSLLDFFIYNRKVTIVKESWKDIKGFEDYQISNMGRVKSFKKGKKIFLKHNLTRGYHQVCLCRDGNQKMILVHILVWDAFGSGSRGDRDVDHVDDNQDNNCITNLQLLTHRQNVSKGMIQIPSKTSKYVGVSYIPRMDRWQAYQYWDGKQHHLGYFDDEDEARSMYEDVLQN